MVVALVVVAACAARSNAPKQPGTVAAPAVAPPRADPANVVGIRRVYEVDFAHSWEPGLGREQLLARTEDVVGKRVTAVIDGAVVRRTRSGVEVFLPERSATELETCRRLLQLPGRFHVQVVDDGSAFMATLAARVRAEPPPGVFVWEDRWTGPGGSPQHDDLCLAAPDRERLTGSVNGLVARIPLPSDREIVLESGSSAWRTYYVIKGGGLDNADVAEATVRPGAHTGRPELVVVLTAGGRRKLAELTARSIGRKLAFVVDGTVAVAPIVESSIPSGIVHMSGGYDAAPDDVAARRALDDLAEALSSGPLPAPLTFISEDWWPPRPRP